MSTPHMTIIRTRLSRETAQKAKKLGKTKVLRILKDEANRILKT